MLDDIEALVAAVNAPLTVPEMNRTVGAGTPRFELYHFALSLCSQKCAPGQTEGRITKLKLVKGQMYGRGKIDLQQARLIGAS